jgi:tRNA-Thr(GGU) m(6)t(6)A37 methyltransferase TsaA
MSRFEIRSIGHVESTLADPRDAPRQADEGAPDAWLVFDPDVHEAARDLSVGDDIVVLTWLHLADRTVLSVHPRGDTSRPQEGVFTTRSPHRPNPIGLHRAEVVGVDGLRVRVKHLEAVNGTPIVDIKPVLNEDPAER